MASPQAYGAVPFLLDQVLAAWTLGKSMQFLEADLGPLMQGNPGSWVSRAWSRRKGMSSGWPCPRTLWTPYLVGFCAAEGGPEEALLLLRSKGNIQSGYVMNIP